MRNRMVCPGGYSGTAVQAESKSMPDPEDITDECHNANINNDRTDNLATFAGGCFWCMVAPFERQHGVKQVISGYTGGYKASPTYQEVLGGSTGHFEAVQIAFDPAICPYTELLDLFWQQIDPTDPGGQFYDRGESYRTVIFYHDENQKRLAEASKKALAESGKFDKPITTLILPASAFYPAEEYHQDYHKKNPVHYEQYRIGSGRDTFIRCHWEKPYKEDLKKRLTPLQYEVTQNNATEPPFQNEFWDNSEEGPSRIAAEKTYGQL